VAGELERWEQSPAEMETEFGAYPEEIRQAALEYARGLRLERQEPEPLPDGEDVKFILVGVQQAGRAILFASSQVTETRFARQVDGVDRVPICPGENAPCARIPRLTAIVGAKMTSFEQHIGDDYASALATMLSEWERRRAASRRQRRPEIGPGEAR
jgi:hypothetical protein